MPKRVNEMHKWLMDRGWVKVGEAHFGNRTQFRWSHPEHLKTSTDPNRTWSTTEAEYCEMQARKRKDAAR